MGRQKSDPPPAPKGGKPAKSGASARPGAKAGAGSPSGADDDRRRHRRVPAAFPFRILTGDQEETFDLVDLSESGVRIRCRHAIAPMTKIRVSLTLPAKRIGAGADVRFETLGVVVWSHRTDSVTYDTGVFFSDVDERQRSLLRAFVGSHGETSPQPA
jgi:hypothetical protein